MSARVWRYRFPSEDGGGPGRRVPVRRLEEFHPPSRGLLRCRAGDESGLADSASRPSQPSRFANLVASPFAMTAFHSSRHRQISGESARRGPCSCETRFQCRARRFRSVVIMVRHCIWGCGQVAALPSLQSPVSRRGRSRATAGASRSTRTCQVRAQAGPGVDRSFAQRFGTTAQVSAVVPCRQIVLATAKRPGDVHDLAPSRSSRRQGSSTRLRLVPTLPGG